MSTLSSKTCVACRGGEPTLTPSQIEEFQKQLHVSWDVIDEKKIRREFMFKNFKEALVFVNQVAEIAEAEGHHPDIYIYYNKVALELYTHAIGGLHENDFIVASKIELIASQRSAISNQQKNPTTDR